jgi:hypothetical protein
VSYLACEVCPARGLGSDEEPEPAEYLTGEMTPRTPTCRKCIEWAVDNLAVPDLPFVIVKLSLTQQARRAMVQANA